jgi:hypothetical protein
MFFQIGIGHRSRLVRRKQAVSVAAHLSPSIDFLKKKYRNLKYTSETSSCFVLTDMKQKAKEKFAYIIFTGYYKED